MSYLTLFATGYMGVLSAIAGVCTVTCWREGAKVDAFIMLALAMCAAVMATLAWNADASMHY